MAVSQLSPHGTRAPENSQHEKGSRSAQSLPSHPENLSGASFSSKLGHSWKAEGDQAEVQPRECGKHLGMVEDLGTFLVLSQKDNVEMELHNSQDNKWHLKCPAVLLSQVWDMVQTCQKLLRAEKPSGSCSSAGFGSWIKVGM